MHQCSVTLDPNNPQIPYGSRALPGYENLSQNTVTPARFSTEYPTPLSQSVTLVFVSATRNLLGPVEPVYNRGVNVLAFAGEPSRG